MKRVLVTGGGGFVGQSIVNALTKDNVECVVLGRNRYTELESRNIKCLQGDICDRAFVLENVGKFDVVFHVAARAGIWGKADDFYRINVLGTKNIVEACLENSIPALVHTSTPSVVFARQDICGGDEQLVYPSTFLCEYAKTKVLAEKIVLSVDQSALKTCAIRPHLVWGPGDPHLVPRLMERGRSQKLKIVGDGDNQVDITYIDNVARAHILAGYNLLTTAEASAKPYFIGQERPVKLWQWVNELFARTGIPPVEKKVSLSTALAAGGALEFVYKVLSCEKEPLMTRFLAEQLAKSHYFSHEQAHRDFGYVPEVSIEEGMERLIRFLNTS